MESETRSVAMCFRNIVVGLIACVMTAGIGFAQESHGVFNVRDYGASGDGKTLETPAINRAILAASKAGGGTVFFPAGVYLTGTFELLSNITLDLGNGAELEGSLDTAAYKLKSDFKLKGYRSGQSGEGLRAGIIVANHAKNISITGEGVIQGNGTYFMDKEMPHYGGDFDKRVTRQGEDFVGPKFGISDGPIKPWMAWDDRPGALIILADCRHVLVSGITIKDSPNWTVNISECEDVVVDGISVLNNPLIPNNDGINITAQNARISDCNIWTADDGIAANDCENLTVTNCVISSRSSAIRFNRGTYCTFDNLVIRDNNRGIGIYGFANRLIFSNILIQTQQFTGDWWGKAEPIFIAVRFDRPLEKGSTISDIRFSNITADAENGIVIYGTSTDTIKDISFDHVTLKIKNGPHTDASGGNFDLRGLGASLDSSIFAHDTPGMYCQFVSDIRVSDFRLEWGDSLPSYFTDGLHFEHFRNLLVDGFTGREGTIGSSSSAISLSHGSGVTIRNSRAERGTGRFLSIDDVRDQRIFTNNDMANARVGTGRKNFQFRVWSGNIDKADGTRH